MTLKPHGRICRAPMSLRWSAGLEGVRIRGRVERSRL